MLSPFRNDFTEWVVIPEGVLSPLDPADGQPGGLFAGDLKARRIISLEGSGEIRSSAKRYARQVRA
jgi:hypothetical protein